MTGVWVDDHGLPSPWTIDPEVCLAALGLGLVIGGVAAVGSSVRRNGRDTAVPGGAAGRTVLLGRFASAWTVVSAVVGVVIIVVAYLDHHSHEQWFSSHSKYSDTMSIAPLVILWVLGGVLIVGGSYASRLAVRRGPARTRLAG